MGRASANTRPQHPAAPPQLTVDGGLAAQQAAVGRGHRLPHCHRHLLGSRRGALGLPALLLLPLPVLPQGRQQHAAHCQGHRRLPKLPQLTSCRLQRRGQERAQRQPGTRRCRPHQRSRHADCTGCPCSTRVHPVQCQQPARPYRQTGRQVLRCCTRNTRCRAAQPPHRGPPHRRGRRLLSRFGSSGGGLCGSCLCCCLLLAGRQQVLGDVPLKTLEVRLHIWVRDGRCRAWMRQSGAGTPAGPAAGGRLHAAPAAPIYGPTSQKRHPSSRQQGGCSLPTLPT